MRSLPPFGLGVSGGKSGSTTAHSSSVTSVFVMRGGSVRESVQAHTWEGVTLT